MDEIRRQLEPLFNGFFDFIMSPTPAADPRNPTISEFVSNAALAVPLFVIAVVAVSLFVTLFLELMKFIIRKLGKKENVGPYIKLGPFKRDDNLRKWFEAFDKEMRSRNIVDSKIRGRLLFRKIDPAEAPELEAIFLMFDDDYPSLRQDFVEATDKTPVKHDQLRVAFQNRNQQQDESVFDYFEALTSLGHKAFKDTSTKQGIRQIIKERLLSGLRDQTIRAKLSFEFDCDKADLSTILLEAKRLDARLNGAPKT
jgi:hypothetical protein